MLHHLKIDLMESIAEEVMLIGDRRDRIFAKLMSRVSIRDCGYVDKNGRKSECWIYTGRDSGNGRGGGYGRTEFDGGTVATHIAMWVNENGIIPPGKTLDHLCEQRRCIRPSHNEMVTNLQNQRRKHARRKARAET